MTKASSIVAVGRSRMRCANLSHHTFPSECEGLQKQVLGQGVPGLRHLHPSPPSGSVSAHQWNELVAGPAMSWVNPAIAEPSSDCCMNPNGILVCFFSSKSIQAI